MEQINYEKLLRTRPTPDQESYIFDQWKPQEFLIYRSKHYREPITDLMRDGCECICTACQSRAIWAKVASGVCGRYCSAPFGVLLPDGPKIGGQEAICPECGASVRLAHVGSFCQVIDQYSHWCALDRIGDKLVIYCWVAQRDVCKDGTYLTSVKPFEAYVVEQKKVVRLTAYVKFMSSCHLTEEWRQVKICHDTLGIVNHLLPFDPSLLEGTSVENSKLDLYMSLKGEKYPVSYLRLFLRHQNVENLLVQGAGELVAEMIDQEMGHYGSIRGVPKLVDVNWKEKRPAQMLGLNKDEFAFLVSQQWNAKELDLYCKFRYVDQAKLPEDMELFRKSTVWSVNKLIDEGHPVRRCIRYVVKQGEYVQYLLDYWAMARTEGLDLSDDSLRWPKNLKRAHDKVMKAQQDRKDKEYLQRQKAAIESRKPGFRKYYKRMAWTAYSANGILIRPCRNERELIAESSALSHCVKTYAERIALGKTAILFIRRENAPNEPWYTLELDPKTLEVRQNRGKKNCAPTAEVVAFVEQWTAAKLSGRKKEEGAA